MLPLLYLHGLSSGDFVPALEQFLGSTAGLSAATITFATVRLRQRVTKGPARARPASRWRSSSSRPPKARWRAVNAPHLVALVRAGAVFEKGKLVERPDESAGQANAA
jgi:hypothetical protein